MQALSAQYEPMFNAATPITPNTGEQSESNMPTMKMICMTSNENPNNGFNFCFDENATGGFAGLLGFARVGLTESEFVHLVASDEFPKAVEGTQGFPVEQRRWLLTAALPVIMLAWGCEASYSSDPTLLHETTYILPELP
ncbi:hypothetical protein ACIQW5_27735 [Methylorubrum thiocyanatum]|uniref:hypothetical protein n=1 Tax=Methylorubrum thiocyanatum TaxID=47958 RepID=UPI00383AF14B